MIFSKNKQDPISDQKSGRNNDQKSVPSCSAGTGYPEDPGAFVSEQQGDMALREYNETDISRRLRLAEEKIELLHAMFLDVCSNERFEELLTAASDYRSLFSLLLSASRRYMVILAVRDTPGNNLPDMVLDTILRCGFNNFRKDLWYTYVGVVHKGKVICNEGNFSEKKTSFAYASLDGKFELSVRSECWKNGDSGEIVINGRQEGCNLRGINIVIYDTAKARTLMSFALDSHDLKPPVLKIMKDCQQ